MKSSYQRHFVAAQQSHEQQNFRLELAKIHRPDIGPIIRQLIDWSEGEEPGRDYKNYNDIYPGLGGWRINAYRIYTYHLGGNVFIMLHVYKKLTQEMPADVKEKVIKRAKIYETLQRADHLKKYAQFLRRADAV